MLLLGEGGTESRRIEPIDEGGGEYERGVVPLALGGWGAPPDFFFKSMYLRMHFKPF